MPTPTVRVFVSSTQRDLVPEREAIEAVSQQMTEVKFVGMEYFGGRDETIRRASLDEVDGSDIYVGIFAARYGSGITEAEYRRARERGLPCRIYFKAKSSITLDKTEDDPAQTALLNKLKEELLKEHTVVEFSSPEDLANKVTRDLYRLIADKFSPKTHGSARHHLRAPVGDFVGREKEIETLTDALRSGGAAGISGISGMGGIGKTELALYVADRLRDAYPDAQLFVDMRGTDERPRDPADALAECIRAFAGPEQRLPESLNDLTRLYRDALTGKRALVLLDNASDARQVRPLLPPAGSALLVTSREAIPLPGMKTRITLEQLQPAEARELLTGIAPRVPADIADQICYLCGYLPLAIRAAGSLLDITADLDPADYAEQLGDERTRLARIGTEGVDLDVEASLSLSYQRLSPDAARVFRQLAVFPESFDAAAEEVICEDPGHKHLSTLLRRNLILYNADTARYRLHDLARLFADARLNEEERSACQLRHAAHYLGALWETGELYKQGGEALMRGLTLFDLEWRNIQAGQSWAEKQSGKNDTAAFLCSDYPNAGVYLLSLRQHPHERILWLSTALDAARELKERGAEGRHLYNLGLAYVDSGEMKRANEFLEKALVIARELNERQGEAAVLSSMAVAYNYAGETRRAVEMYEQCLIIARELNDRRGEGALLGNLGLAYVDLGEAPRAIEFSEQALAICREVGDRRGEGRHLNTMGMAYDALGEVNHAIEIYEQRLIIARELGDSLGMGRTLGNLGRAYLSLGEVRHAIVCCKEALVIAREIGDRRTEGSTLWNISLAFNQLGDHVQAINHAEAALEIFEQVESPYAERVREQLAKWRRRE